MERVYTTRLIGRDPDLVLHGGGNAAVKIRIENLFGEEEDVLFVKGSGWDMGTIEPQGFTGMRLAAVRKLLALDELSDDDLETQARRILDHCQLPWEDAVLRFHETERAVNTASSEQVRQPIYRSSLHLWRNYEPHLGPLIEILAPLLERLPADQRPGQA